MILPICVIAGCSTGGGPAFVRGPDSERVAGVLRSTPAELDYDAAPVAGLVDVLRERCGENVIIDSGINWAHRPVTIHRAATVQQLLDELCEAADVAYYIEDGVVIIADRGRVRSRGSRP